MTYKFSVLIECDGYSFRGCRLKNRLELSSDNSFPVSRLVKEARKCGWAASQAYPSIGKARWRFRCPDCRDF